jgi:pimeloyl-ACP methyl ester carboxylesterase
MMKWKRARRYALLFGILYSIFCFAFAVVLGEFALHPVKVPISKRPAAQAVASRFGAVLQDVSIASTDGTQLQGWFARPKPGNGDTVILFHGIGDNRQGMIGLAELFLSRGYCVLLPDSRGQGASDGLPTYGDREKSDIRRWFAWLSSHEHPRCVFGMGESMGAAIMLQALKDVPFCGVVAEAPFADFREIGYLRVGQFFDTGSWLGRIALRPAVELAFIYCRIKYNVPLSEISPEKSVIGNQVPILLIHGLADMNIPIRQSERIFENCPGNISFWKVPNAGHCGALGAAGPEFEQRVLKWFSSHKFRPDSSSIYH